MADGNGLEAIEPFLSEIMQSVEPRARKRLAALEDDILADEERFEELTQQLAEPDVYSDGDYVRATLARRDEVRAAIDARYADWEAIAAEIESLEREAAR